MTTTNRDLTLRLRRQADILFQPAEQRTTTSLLLREAADYIEILDAGIQSFKDAANEAAEIKRERDTLKQELSTALDALGVDHV